MAAVTHATGTGPATPRPAARADLRGRALGRLPERVRAAIAEQQDHSERLIGWIQLVVVVLFGTLYLLAPKPFTGEQSFEPVPWVLGLYFGFTLLRLGLAYRMRLPGWLIVLSIFLDMALLMALIWSFHLQYRQPASFYLKAPTLLYVFIFIALRTLRFEVRYVLLAGAVAALGWLGLLGYAVHDTHHMKITRDYVEYMTSNAMLIGAEFDKIVSILVVTGILALAIGRAQRLMVRAMAEQSAARDLARFFAPEIAARIRESERELRPGYGEAREAAILNVDIRGFSALAKSLAPAEAMRLLTEYEARLVPVIQRCGGCIDKFLGDGIMATFGAAVPSPTYAADALNAIDALLAEVAAWNGARAASGRNALPVGMAVATGRVVFGAVGDDTRLEFTVIGEAVNLSAKLEKHNRAENTVALASKQAYDQAAAQGYAPKPQHRVLPGRRVMGLPQPLDIVALAR
jgi:adenylate cyclase